MNQILTIARKEIADDCGTRGRWSHPSPTHLWDRSSLALSQ